MSFTLLCVLVYPLFTISNYRYLLFWFIKKRARKKFSFSFTQKKLNDIYTLPDFGIEYNYAVNFYLFFHGILFLSFFPLKIASMILFYFLVNTYFLKYIFINSCSFDVKLDHQLHDQIKLIFALAPLIYLVGQQIKISYFLEE